MGTYILDGHPLDDTLGRWGLRKGTGIRILPARTASNLVLPGQHGYTPDPNPTFEGGSTSLRILVKGRTYEQMRLNHELLMGIIGQPRLLTLVDQYGSVPGANDRHAEIQVLASVEPELLVHRAAELQVVCSVPGTFWRGATAVDATTPTATTATVTHTLTALDGGTAPITDALIRVKGGFATLTITDANGGGSITINEPCTDTQYIIIDPKNWTARKVTTNTWSGGTNVDSEVVSDRGMGSMLTLQPQFSTDKGSYRLAISATNPSGTPLVTARARKAYL